MFRGPLVFLSLLFLPSLHATIQLLPSLPSSVVSRAIQLDSSGNIYVAGFYVPAGKNGYSAFVAKLTPAGSQIYFQPLGGSFNDYGTALAIGSDGSVYVAGDTNSSDFPITPGAFNSIWQTGSGFLAKLNPSGAIAYATFIGGPAGAQITGIALDTSGDVYLTGAGGPAQAPVNGPSSGFVLEFDPTLTKSLLSINGYGGGLIAVDKQANIYLAGSAEASVTSVQPQGFTIPTLPAGAFQSTHAATFCYRFGSGPGGIGGELACGYQYVAKLNPTGTLLWATYVTGTYGAIAAGMAVDSAGNVIVAGTTNSDDYPVTAGAFQTVYSAAAPQRPNPSGDGYLAPPPSIGYITKVNSTGTALLWSTYFGGSYADQITGMAVTPAGDIVVSGQAQSSDLPALAGTPEGCRPSPNQVFTFVSRIAPDGGTAGPSQVVTGQPYCLNYTCINILYDDDAIIQPGSPLALAANASVVAGGSFGSLASVDLSSETRLSCIVDPADAVQIHTVAPGQLLSLFGNDLVPSTGFSPSSSVAPSTSTFGVYFNGIPAPILYSSAQQINLQVPVEIAGQSTVQMQVVDQQTPLHLSETYTLGVVQRQPAIYLAPATIASRFTSYTECGGATVFGVAAAALNADGTINDCTNPAPTGSMVTLFVNGLGSVTPALTTGAIAPAPPEALTPGIDIATNSAALPSATLTVPGVITGVSQVQVHLPQGLPPNQPAFLVPTDSGTVLRERGILIWVKP